MKHLKFFLNGSFISIFNFLVQIMQRFGKNTILQKSNLVPEIKELYKLNVLNKNE